MRSDVPAEFKSAAIGLPDQSTRSGPAELRPGQAHRPTVRPLRGSGRKIAPGCCVIHSLHGCSAAVHGDNPGLLQTLRILGLLHQFIDGHLALHQGRLFYKRLESKDVSHLVCSSHDLCPCLSNLDRVSDWLRQPLIDRIQHGQWHNAHGRFR